MSDKFTDNFNLNKSHLDNIFQRNQIQKADKTEKVPSDHQIGMKVPKGGSSCATCQFLSEDHKNCGNEYFIKWNKGTKLPADDEEYCCDFYTQIDKEIKKALKILDIKKGGAGSGHKIGTTTTGKSVYSEPIHPHHNRFTSGEHEEAAKIHDNLAITEDEGENKRKARNHRYIARVKSK